MIKHWQTYYLFVSMISVRRQHIHCLASKRKYIKTVRIILKDCIYLETGFQTRLQFHNTLLRHRFNPINFMQNYNISNNFIKIVWSRIYSLPMNLHKHQLYLLEQHSESFKSRSAIIRINTEGKSLIIKLGPVQPILILGYNLKTE